MSVGVAVMPPKPETAARDRGPSSPSWQAVAWLLALAGLLLRVQDLGRYAFWNDEAWVALCTRVEGLDQFWLSMGTTPLLWAMSLKLLSLLLPAAEFSLRLLPFVSSCLTMWAAYRLGRHLGGSDLAGALALAVIAFDPLSIEHAKVLKQYSAEGLLGILTFHHASIFDRRGRPGDLVRLWLTICVGVGLANSQLFVAPAVLAPLLAGAVLTRHWIHAKSIAGACAAVALWSLLYFELIMAPHLTAALQGYWHGAYVPGVGGDAVTFVGRSLVSMLGIAWSVPAMTVAFSCLAACSILVRRQRTAGLGLLVLVAELAGLSSMGLVPFDAPRVMLFLLTIASVQAAAALGSAAGWLWSRRWLWPLVPIGLGLLAYDIAVHREWTTLGRPRQVEGLGPLVTALEKRRGPNDGVLLYYRSTFVHAYYQRDTPVLVPDQGTTVGYRPRIDDPNIVVVTGESAREAAAEVFAGRQRMWFLGSRMAPIEQERIAGGIAGPD